MVTSTVDSQLECWTDESLIDLDISGPECGFFACEAWYVFGG